MVDIIGENDIPADVLAKFSDTAIPTVFAGLNAAARRVAPCLVGEDVDPGKLDEAKLILLGAITRWSQAGSGAFQQQTAGPFAVVTDTRQRGGYRLWPSEITDLQTICKGEDAGKAYSVDTVSDCGVHAEICSLNFGATYCSCGVDIVGTPIFEV